VIYNQKKRKRGNQTNFYINRHLKDCLGMEITASKGELMPEGELTSFTVHSAYLYFAGQA